VTTRAGPQRGMSGEQPAPEASAKPAPSRAGALPGAAADTGQLSPAFRGPVAARHHAGSGTESTQPIAVRSLLAFDWRQSQVDRALPRWRLGAPRSFGANA
jgi:hypothetical protein